MGLILLVLWALLMVKLAHEWRLMNQPRPMARRVRR